MQALVIALDAAIASVGRGSNFFNSMVWDALASRWSTTYLEAVAPGRPERWSGEFDSQTGREVDRDLARAGINWEELLTAARNGYGLYTVATDSAGSVLTMNDGLCQQLDEVLADDDAYGRYRRREMSRMRLALADDDHKSFLAAIDDEWGGEWGTRKVASGFAYDVSKPGRRKMRAIDTYQSTICYLVAATFVADVDEMDTNHRKIMRADYPSEAAWRRARKAAGPAWLKTDGRLNSWRAIRKQLATTHLDDWGHVAIRSRYVVTLGGRFQNLDFWLSDVPSDYRERWFRMGTRSGDRLPPVGRDISSSQLWVLAVLLGDTELEELLKLGSFWTRAARRLWERHADRLVGFTGPDDPLLIKSCKSAVMTRVYGSPLTEIGKRLANDSEEFGPGLDVDAIELLIADDKLHLKKSLDWYLPACRAAARAAHRENPRRGFTFTEPVDEVLQIWNPLRTDKCRVAGNSRVVIYGERPVRQIPVPVIDPRAREPLKAYDMNKMFVHKEDAFEGTFMGLRKVEVPGLKRKPKVFKFVAGWRDVRLTSADGTERDISGFKMTGVVGHKYPAMKLEKASFEVWLKKLESRVAPCIAHHMDTSFCVEVTDALVRRGVDNIVPVHDNWYVPADDEDALEPSIEEAGEGFLRSLGPSIVAAFELYLGKSRNYGAEVGKMRERYDARVKRGDWPKFRSAKK